MEPKEKAHYYTELVKVVLQRWQGTQKNQWTFNAIFWTGILLSAPYLQSKGYSPGWEFFWFGLCVVGGYGIIVYLIQKTLDWDKEKFKGYREELENILGYADSLASTREFFKIWLAAQIFMTIVLLTGIFLFLTI